MSTQKVSVVIPAYNCAPYIAMTVRAALVQRSDRVAVEVIVVDDGSTDGLADVLAPLRSEITFIRQANGGVSSARNAGLAAATGEFVCFLDADDVLAAGWFAEALAHFERQPELGVVFGRFRRWMSGPEDDPEAVWREIATGDAQPGSSTPVLSGWIYHHMLLDSWVLCSAAVIRRQVALEAGGFEVGVPMGEDWDFWIRVSRLCPVHQVDRVVVLYRQHATQASRRVRDINYGARMIERNLAKWGFAGPGGVVACRADVHATLARLHLWHALAHFDKGCYRTGLAAVARAARYRPRHLATLRLLLAAVLGLGRPYVRFVSRNW